LGLYGVLLLSVKLCGIGDCGVMGAVLQAAGIIVDGSPVPLGSAATHEPTAVSKTLWARWKSLEETL